jgi:hypothetical protein
MPPVRRILLFLSSLCSLCLCGYPLRADAPLASYIFPAGGKRGTTVKVRVGGLNLHDRCGWELLGPGVRTSKDLTRTTTRWFEGPMLPLPASQRQEDYPRDMAGEVQIEANAPPGVRRGRLWTSQGASAGLAFVVGYFPEVVEEEIDGDPVPVEVKLPVTINGRIFPRENVDAWSFAARTGQVITCEVHAERLGSPLDSRLEVRGPDGKVVAENDDARGADSLLHFTASEEGKYQVRISDSNRNGGPQFVYRLTITAGPHVTNIYPLGGRRGTKTRFALDGANVPREPVEIVLPGEGGAAHLQRFEVAGKLTSPVALAVDDLPEVLKSAGMPQTFTLPAVLNGRIDRPGEVDAWSFAGRKGQMVALQMQGWRLGSPLRGVLEIVDHAGKTLARAGHQQPTADPALSWTVPQDGTFTVHIRDYFRNRGGPAFAYRLRATVPAPDFRLELSGHTATVQRGAKAARPRIPLRLVVQRQGGFNGPIELQADGLPAGVAMTPKVIAAGQTSVDLTFTATEKAAIGPGRLTIRGTATVAGKSVAHTATLSTRPEEHPVETLLLAVALPAPFKLVGSYDLRLAPRGTVFRKHFKIERNGYAGPLEVRLADQQARHLQGVSGPVLTISAGANEFDYPLTLPPWMETGRTARACVMALGRVSEGGVEHVVSYTSQAQNDQIIAVVETGRLGLELGRTSVAVKPGGTVSLPVSIRRGKGLTGAVKIELVVPEHVHGLTAAPLSLGPKESAGALSLKTAAGPVGPFNMPVLVRATLLETSGPVTAEARLEIVQGEK